MDRCGNSPFFLEDEAWNKKSAPSMCKAPAPRIDGGWSTHTPHPHHNYILVHNNAGTLKTFRFSFLRLPKHHQCCRSSRLLDSWSTNVLEIQELYIHQAETCMKHRNARNGSLSLADSLVSSRTRKVLEILYFKFPEVHTCWTVLVFRFPKHEAFWKWNNFLDREDYKRWKLRIFSTRMQEFFDFRFMKCAMLEISAPEHKNAGNLANEAQTYRNFRTLGSRNAEVLELSGIWGSFRTTRWQFADS